MNKRTNEPTNKRTKIISGGQTGVDRAALDVALELGIPCGGWCPRGRLAEDGVIDEKYPLKETKERAYEVRTEWNVRDSDATLIITRGKPTGGTGYTVAMTRKYNKPVLIIDLAKTGIKKASTEVRSWIARTGIEILNIAGPRSLSGNSTCHREEAEGRRGDPVKSISYTRLLRRFAPRNDRKCHFQTGS